MPLRARHERRGRAPRTVTLDRLIRLSMTRATLRHYRLDSPDAWRSVTPEQRAHLEPDQRALVDRAIREDRGDVLAALFSPVGWHAAELLTDRADRLLVIEGREPIAYRADDPEGERRAWAVIRAATRP